MGVSEGRGTKTQSVHIKKIINDQNWPLLLIKYILGPIFSCTTTGKWGGAYSGQGASPEHSKGSAERQASLSTSWVKTPAHHGWAEGFFHFDELHGKWGSRPHKVHPSGMWGTGWSMFPTGALSNLPLAGLGKHCEQAWAGLLLSDKTLAIPF